MLINKQPCYNIKGMRAFQTGSAHSSSQYIRHERAASNLTVHKPQQLELTVLTIFRKDRHTN
jgi:hypothetical protein